MSFAKQKKSRISLYDLTPSEMESFFVSIGEKPYRAKQVLDFLYRKPVNSFDELTSLPKILRNKLAASVCIAPMVLRTTVDSPDGTIKHAYEIEGAGGGVLLESVWMPAESTDIGPMGESGRTKKSGRKSEVKKTPRHTLCISSQLGCAGGCRFCATGKLKLKSQLTTGQIVFQVMDSLRMYGVLPDAVLFMGMGEPMHNFDAVSSAVKILTHPDGPGLSPRRIVMSTSGELERLGAFRKQFPRVRLAISLNAGTNRLRGELIPINEQFGMKTIASFIKSLELVSGEKVTLEYVILGGVNDTSDQVKSLVRYLRPLSKLVKVNLIPFNPVRGINFKHPEKSRIFGLQNALREIGVMTFIRRNRGREAKAACGQLGGKF